MMTMSITVPAIVLGLLSLIWIAVLARIFFLPGEWNLQWWLNTAPFAVGGIGMLGVLMGWTTPLVDPLGPVGGSMAILAVVMMAVAVGLVGFTLGTHRRRLALWHQNDDAPAHLVSEGAYARIRHPFYTSYLVTLTACVLAAPHWINLLVLVFVAYRLNATAAREEARFLASPTLGAEYASYMNRTGRFVPLLWAPARLPSGGEGLSNHGPARSASTTPGASRTRIVGTQAATTNPTTAPTTASVA
jgi:protein-S-isoprenylcysteine O-methyltransferase Ste14